MTQQALWAAALLHAEEAAPEHIKVPGGAEAAQRFNIHRNNVVVSLIDALASTYPVVQQLVGEPFFRAMAQVYATRHPPASPVLVHYGATFPAFIAAFAPAQGVPYLASVAELEWLRLQATHAADANPLTLQDIMGLLAALPDQDSLQRLCCRLHPSLRVLHARHAAVSLWMAHQTDHEPELAHIDTHSPESAWVFRLPNMDTAVVPTTPAAAHWLDRLLAGGNWQEAHHAACQLDPGVNATELWLALVRWPLVTGLVPKPPHTPPH